MCSAVELVVIAVNILMLFVSGRALWRLRKLCDQTEQALNKADATRAQARKLRDEWKIAKILSDATKDRT
jgi:hypothetical protein